MSGEVTRDKFPNKIEYFLTSLSYAVGLGNVWRFPYLCYRNGGGSFFIPYFFSLIFLGVTFFFFESTIGQFTSLGPIQVWRLSPFFKGIGYAMFIMCTYVGIYYNMIVAWAIYYVYASFTELPTVPWGHCGNIWNTPGCTNPGSNGTRVPRTTNETVPILSPSQEYFYFKVLNLSPGIEHMGQFQPHLLACLAIAWMLIFLGLSLGAKSLGKISYFTAIFPYVMITALLVNGVQLEGAMDGILHYVKPDFEKLKSVDVWADAGTQIFYSLSICMGGVITLASYNPFHNNTIRDSVIIVVCNSLTSIYAGFAIFSVIGFMANQIEKPIDEAADQGVGLAFVAYPAALARLPLPWLWSVIFFLMIITLGFGSQMTIVETVVSNLIDFWPEKLQRRKPLVLAAVCVVMFCTGLPMCTQAGVYILQLMDSYSVPYAAFIIAFCEVIAIAWVYGIDRHLDNIRHMMGFAIWPRFYWKWMFKLGSPFIIVVILGLVFANFKPTEYNGVIFPLYADGIGWLMTLLSVLMIPGFAVYEMSKVWRGQKSYKEIFQPEVDFNNQHQSGAIEASPTGYKDGVNPTIEITDEDNNKNNNFMSRLTSFWNNRTKSFKP